MTQKIIENSMAIILHAGDARLACQKSLEAISAFNFQKAQQFLDEAQKNITVAHKVQTDMIQGETRGEKADYSILLAHAQDTLMTINSEILIAKNLLTISKSIDQRISRLESKGD